VTPKDKELAERARERERECEKYPSDCPCGNDKCSHGISFHESCCECKRFIVVCPMPKMIVMQWSKP
jgi:hypothetical protein